MKIENMLQRLSCISFLFKPSWFRISVTGQGFGMKFSLTLKKS